MSLDKRMKGAAPQVSLSINGREVGEKFAHIHWISFRNNGYIVRGRVKDPYYNIMRDLVGSESGYEVLRISRDVPSSLIIKLKVRWVGAGTWTQQITAIITNLESKGDPHDGILEFIAVDPPSWRLSCGRSSGKIYVGKVSQVIKQVVNEYAPDTKLTIDETEDDSNGRWAMMRMDPRNFIMSLLDWSSSVTKKKSTWVVNSEAGDKNGEILLIQEVCNIPQRQYGQYIVNTAEGSHTEVPRLETLSDQFLTVTQTSVITQGLSTVTGKYIDKITEKEKVTMNDKMTGNKVNAKFGQERGYKKPDEKKPWSTTFMAIPEHSAGDIGIKYPDYLDGRARNAFIRLLNMVMRSKLTITGDPKFDENKHLGVGIVNVVMNDAGGEPYFLSGNWMLHGYQHIVMPQSWYTHLYLSRLDFDANAKQYS